MNEKLLREALAEERACGDAEALRALRPEILRAAAALRKKRAARRQNLLFVSCACLPLLTAALVLAERVRGGGFGPLARGALLGAAICMALTLALSPLMAYCLEKEKKYEET